MDVTGIDYVASLNSLTPLMGAEVEGNVETNGNEILLINTHCRTDLCFLKKRGDPSLKGSFNAVKESNGIHKVGVPSYQIVQLDLLEHSVSQDHDNWVRLAQLIQDNYYKYQGFVVYNGTDDMVSTATALSFMLENLGKPVIFTSSLIPSDQLYTDLQQNLILALLFAKCRQVKEVCILFDKRLLRANRTVKVSRSTLTPFDSPHFPPLAAMVGKISLHTPLLRVHPRGRFSVMSKMSAAVLCLKLGPSMPVKMLERSIGSTKARAIVILAYGGGNAPSRGGHVRHAIQKAVDRGIVVVICTQNLYGTVDLDAYETGNQLQRAGAISAHDMTIEASIMKLKYLIGVGLCTEDIKKTFSGVSLRGELSIYQAML